MAGSLTNLARQAKNPLSLINFIFPLIEVCKYSNKTSRWGKNPRNNLLSDKNAVRTQGGEACILKPSEFHW